MEGWDREFSSVKELTDSLKTFVLKSGSDNFTVRKCCLPKQGGLCCWMSSNIAQHQVIFVKSANSGLCAEISNLLVKRQGGDLRSDSGSLELNLTQLRFHQIKDKEITQVIRKELILDCDKNTTISPHYSIKHLKFPFI